MLLCFSSTGSFSSLRSFSFSGSFSFFKCFSSSGNFEKPFAQVFETCYSQVFVFLHAVLKWSSEAAGTAASALQGVRCPCTLSLNSVQVFFITHLPPVICCGDDLQPHDITSDCVLLFVFSYRRCYFVLNVLSCDWL